MVDVAAVKNPEPDPKIGKARPRSEVSVPYYDLAKSIEVARLIHHSGGGSCDRSQLAALLKYSGTNNGGFLSRISAAKAFGLIEENGDQIVLTESGKTIISPVRVQDAEQAKLDAFLGVEFFKQLFDELGGTDLPQEVGLKNLFKNKYKVVQGRVDAAVRIFLDSADQAGLFRMAGNRSKMVKPIISTGNSGAAPPAVDGGASPPAGTPPPPPPAGSDEATSLNAKGVHPALIGLVQNLPPIGATLGPKRRKALVDAFSSTINFVYPEEE